MPEEKKQFVFVQIPKTAGTTFTLSLSRQFNFKKKVAVYIDKPGQSYSKYTPDHLKQFDLVFGHFSFHTQAGANKNAVYYTFLRKPRELLLSGYKYIKGDGIHGVKKKVNIADYSLKDLLKGGLVKRSDNLMVRYLSGNTDKDHMTINEQDLELAIRNFDTYFHIFGITESFDESLVLLSDHMHWPPLYYVKENISSYKINSTEFDEETEKLIAASTKYDEVLYKHALDRFNKMLSERKEAVKNGLEELKQGNKNKKQVLSLRNKVSLLFSSFIRKIK